MNDTHTHTHSQRDTGPFFCDVHMRFKLNFNWQLQSSQVTTWIGVIDVDSWLFYYCQIISDIWFYRIILMRNEQLENPQRGTHTQIYILSNYKPTISGPNPLTFQTDFPIGYLRPINIWMRTKNLIKAYQKLPSKAPKQLCNFCNNISYSLFIKLTVK